MNPWIINVAGVVLMAFIVWWFWLWQPKRAHAAAGAIDITVDDGVYDPAFIEMQQGDTLTLRFLRKDPSPCAEQVIFHGLDISEELPVDKVKEIRVHPDKPGEYRFTCQMQMYQGKLKVNA